MSAPTRFTLHSCPRLIMSVAFLAAVLTVSGVTASSGAIQKARDLLKSTTTVGPLAAGTTYGARLIDPTPNLTPTVGGWFGTQFLDHQSGKVRYETAILFWHGQRHEVDIFSGPAMTLSPADTLARPLSRQFNFAPYDPPTPVKHWTVAGRQALYFDATAPPPGEWTLVGANPPEFRMDHDNSFRMAALTVRGKTVVIVIHAAVADFKKFLPVGVRLMGSLRFPAG
jgi:hypothetical protein